MQKTHISRCDFEMVCAARNVLEKEYYRHYTLDELAATLGTNDQKLKTCFKEVTGKTLYEYLTLVRIEKAKDLLENSRLSLTIVAKRLGLDKSNLNKSFKKATGVTPVEWRRLRSMRHPPAADSTVTNKTPGSLSPLQNFQNSRA